MMCPRMKYFWLVFVPVAILTFCRIGLVRAETGDLTGLSIEELMSVQVTSVSKKAQSLSDSAAAIFVITNDDLRRSDVTTIADALRMVPGMNVARINANKWAVNSRGSTSRFAGKLLVMIDGRSVYTPDFSGVYWEVQDVMLEDVERIEVIRGPGAVLWGTNAVNGVINVITKHAADTQGGMVTIGGGTEERGFAGARYGMSLGEGAYGRLYVKGFRRDQFVTETGNNAGDDWGMLRSGFRLDSTPNATDSITLQRDIYEGEINRCVTLSSLVPPYYHSLEDDVDLSGDNLITRWQRTISSTEEWTVQVSYHRTEREEALISVRRNTLDLDLQHRLAVSARHDVVWGARYRYTHDKAESSMFSILDPASRSDDLFSLFVQDEITIVPKLLLLTVGSKFEHNDYSGYEVQPSARLLWAPCPTHKLWAAVSRAVRTPSRYEQDGWLINVVMPPHSPPSNPTPFPMAVTAAGSQKFDAEDLMASEVGYRFVPARAFSVDVAVFYHDYEDLRSIAYDPIVIHGTYIEQPLRFENGFSAYSYGVEVAASWQANALLKLNLSYSYLNSDMEEGVEVGDEPRHMVSLRAAVDLRKDIECDIWFRYVDQVTALYTGSPDLLYTIDAYVALDLRCAWRLRKNLELALVGRNLLDDSHVEFVQEAYTSPTEVERGVYGMATYRFELIA